MQYKWTTVFFIYWFQRDPKVRITLSTVISCCSKMLLQVPSQYDICLYLICLGACMQLKTNPGSKTLVSSSCNRLMAPNVTIIST
jgi:hypothetical protein